MLKSLSGLITLQSKRGLPLLLAPGASMLATIPGHADLIPVSYLSYGLTSDGDMRIVLTNGKLILLKSHEFTLVDGRIFVEDRLLDTLTWQKMSTASADAAYGFQSFWPSKGQALREPDAAQSLFAEGLDLLVSPPVLISAGATLAGVGAFALRDLFAFASDDKDEPPAVNMGIDAQVAIEGSPYELLIPSSTFRDDGNALALSVKNLPPGLVFDSALARISGTPSKAGVHGVTVIATDEAGQTTSTIFQLTIENTNDAPSLISTVSEPYVFSSQGGNLILPGNPFTFDLTSIVDDEDGDVLVFTTSTTLPDGYELTETGLLSGIASDDVEISVNVTDPDNGQLSFELHVDIFGV